MVHMDRALLFITLHTFTMQAVLITRIMMRLMGITITHIIVQVTLVILLTISDLIMVQQMGKAITEHTRTTIGLDTTEHNMLAVLITMLRQASILAPHTRILTIREVLAATAVLEVMLAKVETAVRAGMLELLDQAGLRLQHNHRVVQVNVEARVEEEVLL
jgi:hypothetical protein